MTIVTHCSCCPCYQFWPVSGILYIASRVLWCQLALVGTVPSDCPWCVCIIVDGCLAIACSEADLLLSDLVPWFCSCDRCLGSVPWVSFFSPLFLRSVVSVLGCWQLLLRVGHGWFIFCCVWIVSAGCFLLSGLPRRCNAPTDLKEF